MITMPARLARRGEPKEISDLALRQFLEAELQRGSEDLERGGEDLDRGAPAAPFDLGIPEPRAVDLLQLWKLTGKTADPMVVAGLGDRVPILLSYSVTAFPVDTKPARIWGIRFATSLYDANGVTVDLQPTTELLDIVKVGATAQLDIGIGGKIEVPEAAAAAISAVPGVTLNNASIGASDKVGGKVRISFVMSVPKVIAGPDASAGARWFLYAQDRQLNGSQALLQTALVPRGTTSVTCEIIASVAAAGLFGAKEWHFETARHEVSLAGLGG